ncbi:esterase E4 [Nasonia vitripennis]|uniref:Carboxylesterase type B domain-containing protein n=1 Tax=Nasonia vitripennis TaxID=7425 RepID=A0A7M7G556_NASVI|nr:esterase E4 [Nasonia vitripennis]
MELRSFAQILFCAILVLLGVSGDDSPVVETSLGKIKGSFMTSRLGKQIYSFRGIRYGKPPIGERRFKVPEPIDAWTGAFDASEEGPSCIRPAGRNLSEDCLALNIYTTKLPSKSNAVKRPVIVFFPPGGFTGYSAQSYLWGPQYYLDQDIVLVTVNYRLSALGFISTGDEHAPGNLGLKDQVVALRFVRDHIARFSGDPNSVTISGCSAGSWSVILHMLSPMSRGLFHKAIAMSGSPLKPKLLPSDMSDVAKKQASFVDCPVDDLDKMFECLKKVPAQQFGATLSRFNEFYGDPILIFSPVVEPKIEGVERFLRAQPVDIIRSGDFNHVPLITGVTKDEIVGTALRAAEAAQKGNTSYFDDLNAEWERVAPISFQYDRTGEQSVQASRALKKFYFNDEPVSFKNVDKLAQAYGDAIVGFPVHRSATLMAKYNTKPVHYYKFVYQGRYSYQTWSETKKPYGVVHHDDLIYVFYISYAFPFFDKDAPETPMVEKMTSIWANFAKTGEPIPKNNDLFKKVKWNVLTPENHKYLEINDTFAMKANLFADRYELWGRLFPLPTYQKPEC